MTSNRPENDSEEEALRDRLDKLGKSIDGKRDEQLRNSSSGRSENASGMAQGFKIAAEFTSAVIVGGLLGWLVDKGLGSTPFGMIAFLLLGFVAGVLNVLRATGKTEYAKPSDGKNSSDGDSKNKAS